MTQITLTLGQSERVKEVFPGVYVFDTTAANAICKVAQEYVDSYYDKSMVEDLSENDKFKLSKMYPKAGSKKSPFVDLEQRICYTAGLLEKLSGDYHLLHDLVWDSLLELRAILKEDLGIKYNFRSARQDELLVYPAGHGFFDFHQDTRHNGRTATYLFYVNDDYEGGGIEFKNVRDSEGERVVYKPKKGELLIMPTTWWTEHRSLANTGGEKIYILAQVVD
ncbi:MAG: hypothetical protein CL489_11010 [Acidobacteria bacterium]|nr:hypothetical protein [Acidobacteriota bacterium]